MALRKHINPRSLLNPDTGFGVNPSSYGGRFVNKDGSYNIIRKGVNVQHRVSIFQKMIAVPTWEFFLILLVFFIGINVIFAFAYYLLGVNQVDAVAGHNSPVQQLAHLFFFSAQTFTTVTTIGYSHISLNSVGTSILSSFEALCGLLSFAILTGLVYSRFARPRTFLIFSRNALIAPYKDKTGLMFRFVSYKDRHNLIDANVKVSLGLTVEENGVHRFRFYSLQLERYHVDALSMNWTVVHPIDEKSPLHNFSSEDLQHAQAELYVQVTGFDQVFSSTVVQQTSYFYNEIIHGAKFVSMYHESKDDTTTILELDKLNTYEQVDISKH